MNLRTTAASAVFLTVIIAGDRALSQAPRRPRADLIELFSQLDANGDQHLDRGEIPEAGLDSFDTLLKHGDTNEDGRLEASEFRGLFERLRALTPPSASPRQQAAFFRSRDRNEDGVLSRDEFPGPAPLFDRLDSDRSGSLSAEELRRQRDADERPGGPQPGSSRPTSEGGRPPRIEG
jgi:Ca2+-binding EF-hand superfamily protein